jgi:dTDP-4-amino-4,6-dideoxygalactose transaminase
MIPILDLRQQYLSLKDEIDAAIQGVLESGQFILGPDVAKLEERVANYCGCRYGVGVASGTDALRLTLTALEVGPGDEIITTPFTFIATANTISHCGAQPVFVDIDPRTYNLDPAAVEVVITPRTKGLVAVHLYGQPCDMGPLMAVAKRHGLFVIEDAAQAIGATYQGQRVGSFGDAGCLSFFPSKNLGAYGDGGMVVTNNAALADKVEVLRRQGGKKKYYHEVLGFNSRLDTLQAAILNVKLTYLESWNQRRREAAHRYNQFLSNLPLTTPYEQPGSCHVYHQYTIRAPERDELAAYLKDLGVATMVYYPVPLHRQPLYCDIVRASAPNADRAAQEVLSLPMSPDLATSDQEYISEMIRGFFHDDRTVVLAMQGELVKS